MSADRYSQHKANQLYLFMKDDPSLKRQYHTVVETVANYPDDRALAFVQKHVEKGAASQEKKEGVTFGGLTPVEHALVAERMLKDIRAVQKGAEAERKLIAQFKAEAAAKASAPLRVKGYTMQAAWTAAMKPGGSHSVVDLEGGGYAVPVERAKKIEPPSKTSPILAKIPRGFVQLLPGAYGQWRVVSIGR